MNIQVEPRTLSGTVSIPASKSMTHRMLICAALAEGTSVIEHVSFSKDITATMEALSALGADFETNGSTITVTGINQVATTQRERFNLAVFDSSCSRSGRSCNIPRARQTAAASNYCLCAGTFQEWHYF